MKLEDWKRVVKEMPADTPVIFYQTAEKPLTEGGYCDGLRVAPSRMWEGHRGWVPCVLVELGQGF